MTPTPRYALPGSDRRELRPNGVFHPRCHPDERAEVTIRLTTDAQDAVRAVSSWAISEKLAPTFASPRQKLVKVAGSMENLQHAFGVELLQRELPNGGTFRGHYGPASVPLSMAKLVSGVFGLDNRPCAKPRLAKSRYSCVLDPADGSHWWNSAADLSFRPYKKPPGTFTPLEVAEAYQFPAGDGEGQTIALIELGGGYKPQDLRAYWQYLGIEGPEVVSVGVNGARNQPGSEADGEVDLDIQVAGAIAPKAKIAVYFAGNTDQNFMDCISQAVHDEHLSPSVISISWGGPESNYSEAALAAFDEIFQQAAAKGITVLVASGDNGSTDGESDGLQHVDFPASSPSVCATGGTRLVANGSTIVSEVVWNNGPQEGSGGGGCSNYFPRAPYQTSAAICQDKQGTPDVSALADPETGYVTRIDGRFSITGGTSACAPLLAGLVARCNTLTGKRAGLLNPVLYSHAGICRDVTSGNNGAFNAGLAWDAASGLGSVNGTALLEALR